jgi:hypothetical protein
MFLAIFEVRPKTERFNDYLALAKRLRPTLFASIYNPGKLALLALWRDPTSANARIPRKSAPAIDGFGSCATTA